MFRWKSYYLQQCISYSNALSLVTHTMLYDSETNFPDLVFHHAKEYSPRHWLQRLDGPHQEGVEVRREGGDRQVREETRSLSYPPPPASSACFLRSTLAHRVSVTCHSPTLSLPPPRHAHSRHVCTLSTIVIHARIPSSRKIRLSGFDATLQQ